MSNNKQSITFTKRLFILFELLIVLPFLIYVALTYNKRK